MSRLRSFYEVHPDNWLLQEGSLETQDHHKQSIRQWILREILETYNYPTTWLGNQISLVNSESIDLVVEDFFGICLSTTAGDPFFWIYICEEKELEKAENSLATILLSSNSAGLGIVTDGTEQGTKFLRRRFDSDKCEYIVDIDVYYQPDNSSSLKTNTNHNTGTSNQLITLSERAENVFFEIHSYIRDIDGFHADEALDELCKILYVKLYDEEMTKSDEAYRLQRALYGSVEEFAAVIRALYVEATEYDTRVFSLKIPAYQRSRGVFNTKLRLSSPALVKVVEALEDYDISHSDTDVKGRAFQKVINPVIRAGMGQYFTPDPVVRFMVNIAHPQISDLILDPFCGSAHFLTACLQFVRDRNRTGAEKKLHEFAFSKLHGIEKSDRMVRIAMTDMRLQGDGHSNIRCTDALLEFSNYPDLKPSSFDLILTNPPFGSLLGSDAISQIGESYLSKGRKTCPLEVLGIERSIKFLRPGGRIGIVLPDGILANRISKYVRDWLQEEAKIRAIISLPVETFSPFGANIKTSILIARKWRKIETKNQDYSIFLARIDNIGYDTSGRTKEISDFDEVAKEYEFFLAQEGW
ncbi:SAM-dependent DNA methyltransferase [Phormidium sp. LEGE 05292]|uniref:HsdM family class I SAM-dependent methyltransferase n=1 Tax=[Phormidium] sp. LEGE 05292 TaxID=767427 RepID=UPI00187E5DFB|nr:N-6 DNA methylase [Phormidium sp. LEGE 05292]MBE9227990.1 SAM-dependent DNA methyltransferase [Phormidium sp. LEGE 05292]